MKKFFLAALAFFITGYIFAEGNIKYWGEGELTWKDFSTRQEGLNISEIQYTIGLKKEKAKSGDTTFVYYKAYCSMDRKMSWVSENNMNDNILFYNQLVFDIAELYKRRLQYSINSLNNPYFINGKTSQFMDDAQELMNKLKKESDFGRNRKVMDDWNVKIKNELSFFDNVGLPNVKKSNWAFGLYMGLNNSFLSGSLSDCFDPSPVGFTMGWEVDYKKSVFCLDLSASGAKFKKDYFRYENWHKGKYANMFEVNFNYGYTVYNSLKLKVYPFIGLGSLSFSLPKPEDDNKQNSIYATNLIGGVGAEYKIHNYVNLVPNLWWGSGNFYRTSVKARLFVTKSDFYNDLKGYYVNFSVSFCGLFSTLK